MSVHMLQKCAVTGVVVVVVGSIVWFGVHSHHVAVTRAVEPEMITVGLLDSPSQVYLSVRDDIAVSVMERDDVSVRSHLLFLQTRLLDSSPEDYERVAHERRMFIIEYLLHNRTYDVSVLGELDAVFD